MSSTAIVRVALPVPLYKQFDYLLPAHIQTQPIPTGARVLVPFGARKLVGFVCGLPDHSDIAPSRLKPIIAVLDHSKATLNNELFELGHWISRYYHHPLGLTFETMVPTLLRKSKVPATKTEHIFCLDMEQEFNEEQFKRAPKQWSLITQLLQHPEGLRAAQLDALCTNWKPAMKRLIERKLALQQQAEIAINLMPGLNKGRKPSHTLLPSQQHAVDTILEYQKQFQTFLLYGITGSGKTEVYLNTIEPIIASGKQALVLVPEIGLTPQLVQRFQDHLSVEIAVVHSNLTDRQRLKVWQAAKNSEISVVVGTRSALFTPFQQLGVIIIDEEHDTSYKQQDGLRYHARNVSLIRAQNNQIPIVLGSATPSLETLYNAQQQRYVTLKLEQRPGGAQLPKLSVLDTRNQKMVDNLSQPLIDVIQQHLKQNCQVIVFLNRRGYSPALLCHACGWTAQCHHCDAKLTYHHGKAKLQCHHCNSHERIPRQCPTCGSMELLAIGYGTERVETQINTLFPDQTTLRLDRDTVNSKKKLDASLEKIHAGKADILIGTQMLSKGHHFPRVSLVAVVDGDQGLYGVDFRASEHMGQLLLQVAGRAGRAQHPGHVVIQTHYPDHPLMRLLTTEGYDAYADYLLKERSESKLPPYSHLALIRANSTQHDRPMQFLHQLLEQLAKRPVSKLHVETLGPSYSMMAKRLGRFHAHLLFRAYSRNSLHRYLNEVVELAQRSPINSSVHWVVDVDPMELL